MFVSADSESIDYLDSKGLIAKPSRSNILANSLMLIAPTNSKVAVPGFGLTTALGRRAMANRCRSGGPLRLFKVSASRAALYGVAGRTPRGIVSARDTQVEPKVHVLGHFLPTPIRPLSIPPR